MPFIDDEYSGKISNGLNFYENKPLSYRGVEWCGFSIEVLHHVENYTVSQYGDLPNDNVTTWSAQDCEKQIEKYVKRFGKGQRGFENDQLDLLKIAHYCCLVYNKRLEEKANDNATEVV